MLGFETMPELHLHYLFCNVWSGLFGVENTCPTRLIKKKGIIVFIQEETCGNGNASGHSYFLRIYSDMTWVFSFERCFFVVLFLFFLLVLFFFFFLLFAKAFLAVLRFFHLREVKLPSDLLRRGWDKNGVLFFLLKVSWVGSRKTLIAH